MGIITTDNLIYEYIRHNENGDEIDRERAVKGISLEINKGEFVAILGHNGSGKSTIAKHINALLTPTSGTVMVKGLDTSEDKNVWEIRKSAGMVFQNPDNQIVATVVEEDVGFGPENLGVKTEEIRRRVDEALKKVGMYEYREHSPNKLSGGQKQRVAVAGIMAMKPDCIILDEPTAMLDPNGRKEVLDTVHQLNKEEGITILLITHYMDEVINADRVLVMDHGVIALAGTPREVFAEVERMRELRLNVPCATEVAYELRKRGFVVPKDILTNEELVKALLTTRKHRAFDGEDSVVQMPATDILETQGSDILEPQGADILEPQGLDILELQGLTYVYAPKTAYEKVALKDINLKIKKGEFVGLIGHTGSGKSTLIQHMNGLEKATEGRVLFEGTDIRSEGYSMKTLRSEVGLVFQYPEHQLFETTVFRDVCFGPKNLGLSKEEIEARATEALNLVHADKSIWESSPLELSGGQKRRVAIAGVLAMKPKILILDEPTAGLDPVGHDEILAEINHIHKETGMTVVLVSHSMEDVAEYAGHLIVMNHGEKAMEGTPKEVFRHYEKLEKMGLAAPQVTYLMHAFADEGAEVSTEVITVSEAVDEISKYLETK